MFFEAFAPLQARVGRAEITQALTCAGYLLVSAFLMWAGAKLPGLIVAVIGAAIAWYLSNRRWHLIHDTPNHAYSQCGARFCRTVWHGRVITGPATTCVQRLTRMRVVRSRNQ